MMNDSVREELTDKISAVRKLPKPDVPVTPASPVTLPAPVKPVTAELPKPQPPAASPGGQTAEILVKPTSRTLLEFQTRTEQVPEWRLHLKNAVQQRAERRRTMAGGAILPAFARTSSTAKRSEPTKAEQPKQEIVEKAPPAQKPRLQLDNVLRRIEESRQRYLPEEDWSAQPLPAAKLYSFQPGPVGSPNQSVPVTFPGALEPVPKADGEDRSALARSPFETTKLPSLPKISVIAKNVEKLTGAKPPDEEREDFISLPKIDIRRVQPAEEEFLTAEEEAELIAAEEADPEFDVEESAELAPLSNRFGAGFVDLALCCAASLMFLLPFIVARQAWLDPAVGLSFAAVFFGVVFFYRTMTLTLTGQTFGMRLFSVEVVDIEENDYPTLFQAAVSSGAYLVSLMLCGIGFLTLFFDSEKRAAHDLLSGTVFYYARR